MTPAEILREMQAATEARNAYWRAYLRLNAYAKAAYRDGFEAWAELQYRFADAALASYRREAELSESQG